MQSHVYVVICKQRDCEGHHIVKEHVECVTSSLERAMQHVDGLHLEKDFTHPWDSRPYGGAVMSRTAFHVIEYLIMKVRYIEDAYKRPED